jgi:hypothetical protein
VAGGDVRVDGNGRVQRRRRHACVGGHHLHDAVAEPPASSPSLAFTAVPTKPAAAGPVVAPAAGVAPTGLTPARGQPASSQGQLSPARGQPSAT